MYVEGQGAGKKEERDGSPLFQLQFFLELIALMKLLLPPFFFWKPTTNLKANIIYASNLTSTREKYEFKMLYYQIQVASTSRRRI